MNKEQSLSVPDLLSLDIDTVISTFPTSNVNQVMLVEKDGRQLVLQLSSDLSADLFRGLPARQEVNPDKFTQIDHHLQVLNQQGIITPKIIRHRQLSSSQALALMEVVPGQNVNQLWPNLQALQKENLLLLWGQTLGRFTQTLDLTSDPKSFFIQHLSTPFNVLKTTGFLDQHQLTALHTIIQTTISDLPLPPLSIIHADPLLWNVLQSQPDQITPVDLDAFRIGCPLIEMAIRAIEWNQDVFGGSPAEKDTIQTCLTEGFNSTSLIKIPSDTHDFDLLMNFSNLHWYTHYLALRSEQLPTSSNPTKTLQGIHKRIPKLLAVIDNFTSL